MALETRIALDTFCVKTPQANPYVVSFAHSITSIYQQSINNETSEERTTNLLRF